MCDISCGVNVYCNILESLSITSVCEIIRVDMPYIITGISIS